MDKTIETIQITLPSSKSLSNRWLVLDYMSRMGIKIKNLSSSDDTQQLARLLRQLKQGKRRNFDCHDAGTAARFLLALLSVTPGSYLLTGSQQLCRRPMGQLIDALRSVGCQIVCTGEEGFLPCKIEGLVPSNHRFAIDCSVSSQFASALLLAAACMPQGAIVELINNPVSEPYIDMTLSVMEQAKIDCTLKGNPPAYHVRHIIPECDVVVIEKDWSSASYFFEASALLPGIPIRLPGLVRHSLQGDQVLRDIFPLLGLSVNQVEQSVELRQDHAPVDHFDFDFTNCPDLVPAVAVTCAALGISAHLTGLDSLKFKESQRILSIAQELNKLNREVDYNENSLIIHPGNPFTFNSLANVQSPIDSHADHRIAMAFGTLKVINPNLQVIQPEVVSKSFPDFWKMLARLTPSAV